MKILIADDHPVVRHGLKQMLTGEPDMLVVGEAKNGNEALELARKLDWDVAILDYSMPGRSGARGLTRGTSGVGGGPGISVGAALALKGSGRLPLAICDRYPRPIPALSARALRPRPRCSRHTLTGFSPASSRSTVSLGMLSWPRVR